MSLEILIYTHSEYQDIWPIVLDTLSKLKIQTRISFAMDKRPTNSSFDSYTIYLYDDQLTYPGRLASLCKQIASDYLFFFHDIDILVNLNQERLDMLMEWIVAMDVDRFALGIFPTHCYVTTYQDIPIAKLNHCRCNWFTSPYDPGPSIWKRSTLEELMLKVSDATYRSIEDSPIQEFLAEKKVFGFAKRELEPLFTIGRPFTPWFAFCHLLIRGQWVSKEGWQSYDAFMAILLDTYKIQKEKRGIAPFHSGMQNGFEIT